MDKDAVKVNGSFSWGFQEKKAPPKRGPPGKKVEEKKEEEPEIEKPLKDWMPLKEIDLTIKKGEFVCIIGDVGSGKSSLFSSIIGDMIYVPDKEI